MRLIKVTLCSRLLKRLISWWSAGGFGREDISVMRHQVEDLIGWWERMWMCHFCLMFITTQHKNTVLISQCCASFSPSLLQSVSQDVLWKDVSNPEVNLEKRGVRKGSLLEGLLKRMFPLWKSFWSPWGLTYSWYIQILKQHIRPKMQLTQFMLNQHEFKQSCETTV